MTAKKTARSVTERIFPRGSGLNGEVRAGESVDSRHRPSSHVDP